MSSHKATAQPKRAKAAAAATTPNAPSVPSKKKQTADPSEHSNDAASDGYVTVEDDDDDDDEEEEALELIFDETTGWPAGVEGEIPIATTPVIAWTNALQIDADTLKNLVADAQTVFVSESFWVPADESWKPRCLFEQLARQIFEHHTQGLDFDHEQSGAEWWTQVRRGATLKNDEAGAGIGIHWDKDEDFVDDAGINVHPVVSTVTYLTGRGCATIVCDKRTHVEYENVAASYGSIPRAWLSNPLLGKHFAFDGRLLHGVPSQLADGEQQDHFRVTFLVNVWLNHQPTAIDEFPKSELKTLKTRLSGKSFKPSKIVLTDRERVDLHVVKITKENTTLTLEMPFGGAGLDHVAQVPLCSLKGENVLQLDFDDPSCPATLGAYHAVKHQSKKLKRSKTK